MYDPIYVLLRAVHRRDFQSSIDRFNSYAQQNGKMNVGASVPGKPQSERATQPWPPWRLPGDCEPQYQDPRVILHSKFAHGLIFNLLYKAVHTHGTSENISSLTVFLLELALAYPQTQFSGQEVAISTPTPWFIVHEPVDLQYDTWFPTDWLSANLRHTVTAIFSNQPAGAQHISMEVDQVSDGSEDDSENPPYEVQTPTSVVKDGPGSSPPFGEPSHILPAITMSPASNSTTLMALGPSALEPINSLVNSPPAPAYLPPSGGELVAMLEPGGPSVPTPELPSARAAITSPTQRSVVNINESIITLLLKLHSKLSGKPDSYSPLSERRKDPKLAGSCSQAYRDCRI